MSMTKIGKIKVMYFVAGISIAGGALTQPHPPNPPCCWPPPCTCNNCEVRVNLKVVKTVQAKDRKDCYAQTSFGSENCKRYASYFGPELNLLEQYFNKTDRVNSERCKGPEPKLIPKLPMQAGNEKTPCPRIGQEIGRASVETIPFYKAVSLAPLDKRCDIAFPGLKLYSVKTVKCAPDPRGKGFGPNVSADLKCIP